MVKDVASIINGRLQSTSFIKEVFSDYIAIRQMLQEGAGFFQLVCHIMGL